MKHSEDNIHPSTITKQYLSLPPYIHVDVQKSIKDFIIVYQRDCHVLEGWRSKIKKRKSPKQRTDLCADNLVNKRRKKNITPGEGNDGQIGKKNKMMFPEEHNWNVMLLFYTFSSAFDKWIWAVGIELELWGSPSCFFS